MTWDEFNERWMAEHQRLLALGWEWLHAADQATRTVCGMRPAPTTGPWGRRTS